MDFSKERKRMVNVQLVSRGIKDRRVLEAMGKVPREFFFTESERDFAYCDGAFPIGEGQTISQPYMVAIMTELLELKGKEKVLEIGTGSGYQAAVLAELVKEVFTIERIPELAYAAERILKEQGHTNINVIIGDGTKGLPEKAPFEGIIVTAAAPKVPEILIEQLSDNGGKLVIPVGDRFSQVLKKITRYGGELTEEESTLCVFVPLVGQHGWKSEW